MARIVNQENRTREGRQWVQRLVGMERKVAAHQCPTIVGQEALFSAPETGRELLIVEDFRCQDVRVTLLVALRAVLVVVSYQDGVKPDMLMEGFRLEMGHTIALRNPNHVSSRVVGQLHAGLSLLCSHSLLDPC
jgi:hypothetical protein